MDRTQWDRPAIVIVVVLAVVLVGASAPFIPYLMPDAQEFDVDWGKVRAGAADLTVPASPRSEATAALDVSAYTASLNVTLVSCEDTANAQFQQRPATIAWRLERVAGGNTSLMAEGTFTCGDVGNTKVVERQPAPEVGVREGEKAETVRAGVWALVKSGNETATYRLKAQWERAAPGIPPLPITPTPTLSAQLRLEAWGWAAAVSETVPQEVPR